MSIKCPSCKKDVSKLVNIDDAHTTAMLSSENKIPMPQGYSVCPSCALKDLGINQDDLLITDVPLSDELELIAEVEKQRQLMIAVSTGGPRIQEKNQEYQERRRILRAALIKMRIDDPNPYTDLWDWYGKWSSGDLPNYQSRRQYISNLYKPLIDYLETDRLERGSEPINEPTGWARVDRGVDKIIYQLEISKNEEDFQAVGLYSRETLISLAQSVYDREKHRSSGGVESSKTDANRMLENYLSTELSGSSNESVRRHAKASLSLANDLQHRRTATVRDAALCAEATRTVVNIVAIISENR